MLITILSTSWKPLAPSNLVGEWIVRPEPMMYGNCSCSISSKCVYSSRGMLTGCYPLESILQSTLACFYNQQCIDPSNKFVAMKLSLSTPTRFPLTTTIESIVNQLMVEELHSNVSYDLYFNQCKPLLCTYSYVDNRRIIEGITTLIGLYGGLLIICHLLAIIIVKPFRCLSSRVVPFDG